MVVSMFNFIPSPLEGEGPATPGMRGQTPHPSLRATLSLKGRGKEKGMNYHG